MALAPCSNCEQRYRGKAAYIYPAIVSGADTTRRKLRLCPSCAVELAESCSNLLSETVDGQDAESEDVLHCAICGKEADYSGGQVYVTEYDREGERHDYWGALCGSKECREKVQAALGL
jgi:hypothetical protein